jgi:hypothetical protein
MTIVELFEPLMGGWRGVNRLRLMPTDEYKESVAGATVGVTAKGFVSIAYTWSEGDEPQDGLLLLGATSDPEGATAVWVDSWHSGASWMDLSGPIEEGVARLAGSYAAPTGPDWGWQIHVEPAARRIAMYNVVPGSDPYEAVEIAYDARG